MPRAKQPLRPGPDGGLPGRHGKAGYFVKLNFKCSIFHSSVGESFHGLTKAAEAPQKICHGVLTGAATTVSFNGTNTQYLDGSAATAFANLTIANTNAAVIALTNFSIATLRNCTVASGADLEMGAQVMSGAGTNLVSAGATLGIGDANGITTLGTAAGNIQTTGGRTYSPGASYRYTGTGAQATGTGLPATVSSLADNNTAGTLTITRSTATTITNFVLATGAKVSLAAGVADPVGTFTAGGLGLVSGTWGGATSGAAHINTNYFATSTGLLNVSTDTRSTPVISTPPTPTTITYGQTLAGSTLSGGAATNALGTAVSGSFAFTTPGIAPNAGTTNVSVTFTASDTNSYLTAAAIITVPVNLQTPVLTAPSGGAITFGQTLAGSGLSGGAATNAANNAPVAGNFAYTTPDLAPNAGPTNVSVTFTPADTANYNGAAVTITVAVNKQTPRVAVAPSVTAITYGQTLASSSLSGGTLTNAAGATVAIGARAFVNPGIAPNAGTTNVSVTLTPTDTANYNSTTNSLAVTVSKANLTLTPGTNVKVYDGTTSATNVPAAAGLQGTDSVSGTTVVYDNATPGTGKTLSITAYTVNDGNGGNNYSVTVNTSAGGTINPAGSTIVQSGTNFLYNAAGQSPEISFSGSTGATTTNYVGVSVSYADVVPPTNAGSYYVSNTVAADANYNGATNTLAFTIGATNLTITAQANTKVYDGTTASATNAMITAGGIQGGDIAPTWTQTYADPNAGAGKTLMPANLVVADGNSGNNYNYTYTATNAGVITKATATVVVTPYTVNYDGNPHTATVTSITGVNGETGATVGTVALSTTHTLAGTYGSDSWSFTGAANYNDISSTTITDIIISSPAGSTIVQSGTNFLYNAAGQSPEISFSGSTGATTTNYVGVSVSYADVVPPTNAGSYYVSNMVAADANYNGATNVLAFTIGATNLTLTPGTNVKVYDSTTSATNVPATAGLQGTDSVSGTTVVYDNAIPGTGKTLSITAYTVNDGNGGNNYVVTVNTSAGGTINPAIPASGLVSSENSAGYHDTVLFTNTLNPDATGYVLFSANSVLWSSNNLSGGVAVSLAITNLPRGTNLITAAYSGDTYYQASTVSLNQIVTNHPPMAGVMNVVRTAGMQLRIMLSDLATNWSDPDGDTVSLAGLNLATTNNVNLLTNSTQILYTNSPNVNDQITYTVGDGYGGTNTGIINVVVNPFMTGQSTASAMTVSNSTLTTTFYGIIGFVYEVQRSTNLSAGRGWVNIATNTVGGNGRIEAVDNFSDLGGQVPASAYYRLKWQP